MKKVLVLAAAIIFSSLTTPSFAATSVTGTHGETLSVSKTTQVRSGDLLKISGNHFDQTVGIYVAMCRVVPHGHLPTPCGGGVDETGASGSSMWISSNPPSYGIGLAKPNQLGGRFSVSIKVSPKIGKLDCRKISCAIYVRADHTRGDDRSYDLKIPLTFTK